MKAKGLSDPDADLTTIVVIGFADEAVAGGAPTGNQLLVELGLRGDQTTELTVGGLDEDGGIMLRVGLGIADKEAQLVVFHLVGLGERIVEIVGLAENGVALAIACCLVESNRRVEGRGGNVGLALSHDLGAADDPQVDDGNKENGEGEKEGCHEDRKTAAPPRKSEKDGRKKNLKPIISLSRYERQQPSRCRPRRAAG